MILANPMQLKVKNDVNHDSIILCYDFTSSHVIVPRVFKGNF